MDDVEVPVKLVYAFVRRIPLHVGDLDERFDGSLGSIADPEAPW